MIEERKQKTQKKRNINRKTYRECSNAIENENASRGAVNSAHISAATATAPSNRIGALASAPRG